MLNCGNTRLYELLSAGELDSFLDGRSRKITVESIRRYVARHLEGTKTQPPRVVRLGYHHGAGIGGRRVVAHVRTRGSAGNCHGGTEGNA